MSKSTVSIWFHGLIGAAVTGAGNGISLAVADGMFDIFKDGTGLWKATIATTLISIGAYMKTSPLKFDDDTSPAPVPAPAPSLTAQPPYTPMILAFLGLTMLLSGCTNPTTGKIDVSTTVTQITPYARSGGSLIGIGLLATTSNAGDQEKLAQELTAAAVALRAVSSDTPPTAAEFQQALTQVKTSNKPEWAKLATSLTSLYSGIKAQFGTNTKAILNGINQIALGLEDAAAPYLPATPVVPPAS